MIGFVIERRTPLKRTAMKRGSSELKRTPIKPRSAKRAKLMRDDRVPLIRRLNAEGVGCLVCPTLHRAGFTTHCAGTIQGMHERRKRSAAGSLVNPQNLIPACNWGNGFIEDNAEQVRDRLGDTLVVREGDPEWAELSKRNDR